MVQKQIDIRNFFKLVKIFVDRCLDIQSKGIKGYKRGDIFTREALIEVSQALSALQFEYPPISHDDDNYNKARFEPERQGNPIIFYKVVLDAPVFGKARFILVQMTDEEAMKVMRTGSL